MSSETDSASPPSLNIEKCALIIVDVAGTTTSINFVQDTLFPYALKHAESFLQSKWDEETVKDCLKDLKENDAELDLAAAVKLVKSLSEKNSDNKGLKTLQGLIYQQGYESGELKAHIFDDVAEAFESWAKARNVAIYSTGSIESQRLLFKHTTSGDVSAHIFKYFDQSIGAKTESESYKKIAKEFQLEPEEVIFVTDNVEEAKAAKSAGITAVLINREGNPAIPEEASKDFKVISSFNELGLEKAAKRKIEDSAAVSEEPPAKVAKTSEEEKAEGEKPKTEEESSMEVDAPAPEEKVVEASKTEEAKVSDEPKTVSETDKVEAATEKTESEEPTTKSEIAKVTEDEEMKPVEEEETKPAEEPKPEETKDKEEKAEEKKPEEESISEKKTEEESISEKKTEEEAISEKKVAEESTAAEKKVDDEEVAEKKVEETTTTTTKEKPAAENGEESKPEEQEEKEEDGEKTKTEESEPKTEEKENKSVLANGVENGNKVDSEIEKNDKESETSEIKKDDLEVNVDKTEVIVKKLEESTESKTVSVEV